MGAADRAFGRRDVQCASLKANMGHLEPAAAAAGLSSLAATSLFEALVPVNAQLRRPGFEHITAVTTAPTVLQVERAPVVDHVHVVVVPHAGRSRGADRVELDQACLFRVTSELLRIQRNYRPRRVCRFRRGSAIAQQCLLLAVSCLPLVALSAGKHGSSTRLFSVKNWYREP